MDKEKDEGPKTTEATSAHVQAVSSVVLYSVHGVELGVDGDEGTAGERAGEMTRKERV